MEAGCGTGWCAFRFRIDPRIEGNLVGPIQLLDRRSRVVLHALEKMTTIQDTEVPINTVDALTSTDPTLISGVWQLRGCEQLLLKFIRTHGVEAFVRAAYIYVLGRDADDSGRAMYSRCIRQSTLSPVGILEVLADSEEYRSRTRQLGTPNSSTFPFV
jgi:hypothetical protein